MTFSAGNLRLSNGKSFKAVSGGKAKSGRSFLPVPKGEYRVHTFQDRTTSAMIRDGVGFSLHLTPDFQTTRKELRIHPDGGELGVTQGCIGISEKVEEAKKELKRMFPTMATVKSLLVK